MNIKKALVLFATVLALGGLVAACSSDDSESGSLVSEPWTRITTPTATTGAVYMTLESKDGDKLLKASVPTSVAAKTEIHETVSGDGAEDMGTTMEGGIAVEPADDAEGSMEGEGATGEDSSMSGEMMGMRPIESLDLPAGEEVVLEPGGYHIMLIDLAKPIEAGDNIPVTLTFENAGVVEVEAEAREG